MRLRCSILLSLSILTGFFSFSQTGSNVYDSIQSGGIFRKYRLYIPVTYTNTKASPLIFNFHGLSSNAIQQQFYGDFMPIADTAGFLIVLPEGTVNGSLGQFWNTGLLSTPDDVAFTRDLMDSLQLIYNIDKNAVYSCGLSNGGILSYYLVCMLPNRFAAIASVTGTMLKSFYYSCKPSVPVPVMEIHGTSDNVVPYDGTGSFAGLYTHIDSVIEKWVGHNRCKPAVTFTLPDINQMDNSTVVHYKYTGGLDGSAVELYKIINGGHTWPGAPPVLPNTNMDFNASVEIWRFFRQFRLNQFVTNVGLKEQKVFSETITVFPNPAKHVLLISGVDEALFSVYNIDGSLIIPESHSSSITIDQLSSGLYFLKIKKGSSVAMFRFVRE